MAKGQKKSNKEIRKPKADKGKKQNASNPSTKEGVVRGLDNLIERVLVSDAFDAADDSIAERSGARSVVVTGDILLADRCLKAGATVIGHNGKPFTAASICAAIATRAIMADLRAGGEVLGGPAPFAKADRSRFLQALDEALARLQRGA
jgi:hypothetical protein